MFGKTLLSWCLLLLMPLSLSGCWDINEPEQMVYAHGIGVEYANGRYTVYIKLLDLGPSTSQKGGKSGSPAEDLIWGEGEDIDEAIFSIYNSADRRIYWGHLSYILFSKSVLDVGGQQQMIDIWDRYFESRYHIWMYAADEAVKKIFQASHFVSRLSKPNIAFEQSSYIRPITMREAILTLDEPSNQTSIPLVSFQQNRPEKSAARISGLYFSGIASITNHGLNGVISESDAAGMRWMDKRTKRAQISIKEGKTKASIVIRKIKPTITPRITKNGKATFDLEVQGNASVSTLYDQTDMSSLNNKINKIIEREVKHTYLSAMYKNIDIYRLSENLYKNDIKTWKRIAIDRKIPLDENSILTINVKINLKSSNDLKMQPSVE